METSGGAPYPASSIKDEEQEHDRGPEGRGATHASSPRQRWLPASRTAREGGPGGGGDGGGSPAGAASPAASPNPALATPKARPSVWKDTGGRGSRSVNLDLNLDLSCGDRRRREERSSGDGGRCCGCERSAAATTSRGSDDDE
jgi:hypothetical protein